MSTAISAGIRVSVALVLGLAIQTTMFSMLASVTDAQFEHKTIKSTRIEFTRVKTDTQTQSRRDQPVIEQLDLQELPQTPRIELASSSLDVSMPAFAPTVDMSGALKGVGIAMGMESEVMPMIRIAPIYPRNAKLAKIQGFVKMEVVINPDGSVNDIEVIEATPPRMFDSAAVMAMKQWRFKPKLVNGVAVSQRAQQVIEFKIEG